MKHFVLTIASILCVASMAEAGTFKGKCSGQALSAAIQDWANVPDPSEDLFYTPISSAPIKARSTTYEVTLGIYDLNDYRTYNDYVVQFKDLTTCEIASITLKK